MITKTSDNSPRCVKPQTAQKLVELGWGIIIEVTTKSNYSSVNGTWIEMNPLQCPDYAQDTIRDWSKTHNNATYPVGQGKDPTTIKNYYKNLRITIYDVKKVETGYGVCAACGCPETYTLKILVSNSDVKKMSQFGFEISKVQQP